MVKLFWHEKQKMKLHIVLLILIILKGGDSLSTMSILPSLCGTTAERSSGAIVKAHAGVDEGNGTYPLMVLNCRYTIQATTAEHKLRFNVGTGMGEVNGIFHDLGCVGARMRIFDSDGVTRVADLCGGVIERTEYLSSRDSLVLEILSFGGNDTIMNFTAQYTSFLDSSNCSNDASVFPCSNGRCVSREGQCDVTLINNCGDFSDNSRGPPGNCSSEELPETTIAETTVVTTTPLATEPTRLDSEEDLIWVAGLAMGLVGSYFLYWLLWKPGYLVWRCSCWRHFSCCRSFFSKSPCSSLRQANFLSKQPPVNDAPSNGKFDDGPDKRQQSKLDGRAENNISSETLKSKNDTSGKSPFEFRPKRVHPAPEPLFGIQRESHFFST